MIREGMNVLRQNENGYKIGNESLRLVLIRIGLGRLVCPYYKKYLLSYYMTMGYLNCWVLDYVLQGPRFKYK